MNFVIYILSYFFIIFSILGYGYLFHNIFFKSEKINLGYLGIFGIFSLTLISYLSNFFIEHNKYHNLVIMVFGFALNIALFHQNLVYQKKNFLNFFVIFSFLIIFILGAKTHDDFEYYHFAYIHLLTQDPTMIGLGNFNHGFRTHSSIFYFASLFYLPKINYELIHIAPVFFLGFTNFILLDKIRISFLDKEKSFLIILSTLSLALINIFFYRLAEHGTDRSAQVLIFLIVIEILYYLNFNHKNFNLLNKIYILIVLTISLKAFYMIYLLLIIPIFIFQKEKKFFLINFIKNKIAYLCFFLFFIVLTINFLNSGCLIYPLNASCNFNLSWSISSGQVTFMNEWYELWSKGGANPNTRVENPAEYIQGFNWFLNWFNSYFFNKVSDYLLGLLFVCLVFYTTLKSKNKNIFNPISYKSTYLIILIIFIEWFMKHPSLRYGGYQLIALMLFIPFSVYLSNKIDFKNFSKRISAILLIILVVFLYRNISRINEEIKVYSYDPIHKPSHHKKFRNYKLYELISKAKKCNEIENKLCKGPVKSKLVFNLTAFYLPR